MLRCACLKLTGVSVSSKQAFSLQRSLSMSALRFADAPKTNRFAERFSKPKPKPKGQPQNRPQNPPPGQQSGQSQRQRPGPRGSGVPTKPAKGRAGAEPIPESVKESLKDPAKTKVEREFQTPEEVKARESERAMSYKQAKEALKRKQQSQTPANSKPQKSNNTNKRSKKQPQQPKERIQISVPTFLTVSSLSSVLNIPLPRLLKALEQMGFENMRHNYILDKENAALIADEFGFEINQNDDTGLELFPEPVVEEKLQPRAPIVTIMGHVDHGKTTILDYLRKSSIVDKEFGGITQHIGAFSVVTPVSKKKITFLDTPGHAAFLKMRERGANVTDIVILVVAGDDSVMPQTIEAIKHAKNAGVPMIVAINKCDKPGLNIDKVLGDLARYEVDIEDYGGDTQTVQVSGKTGLNMDKLEEAVITLSELNEFKAEPTGVASEGWVIETEMVKGMGPIATVLVTRSSVKTGDILVAGTTYCKVRGMKDETGKQVKVAGPSTPVQIWGWKSLPEGGDQILQAKNEQIAKKVVDNRIARNKLLLEHKDMEVINEKRRKEIEELEKQQKINELRLQGFTDEDLKEEFGEEKKTLTVKYIIRSDVFGSAEAIKESLEGLGNEEVRATVVSHEAGPPTDSDVDMASALDAKIVCFNVKVPKTTHSRAHKAGVEIVEHNIIYRLIEQVTEELSNKLPPVIETKILGEATILGVFKISNKNRKDTAVAGCKISNGTIKRSSNIKVLRNNVPLFTGSLTSLKQVKDDVTEIKKGQECGMTFDGWDKFQEGDVVQAYEEVEHKRYL